MPDSERFGDTDVDTFGHILERMQTLDIPNLTRLGDAQSALWRSDAADC